MPSHRFRLPVLLAVSALATLCGCAREPLETLRAMHQETGVKVLLVGLDGGTFRVLEPLVRQGRAPFFASMLQRGAHGPLRSELPMRSPALWTTIATGKERQEHGIRDFVVGRRQPGGAKLVSSNHRRTLALWNILTAFRLQVGFAGWWATWPAEPVTGWILSDRLAHGRWVEWSQSFADRALTYPAALTRELADEIRDPTRPAMDEIERMIELSAAERAEFLAVRKPIFAHGLSVFKFAWAAQRTYEGAVERLLARRQPDLTGLLLIATDPVSHTFWHLYEPEAFEGVDRERAARLGRLVPAIYEHDDRYLARLAAHLDPRTVLLVVSDHGFRASGHMPRPRSLSEVGDAFDREMQAAMERRAVTVGQSGEHDLEGIFLAAGGPVRTGVQVEPELLDIAPTLLALLGLPVPEDMPGRVLTEILEPSFLERHPVRRIPTYEGVVPRHFVTPEREADDSQTLEMLRSLGYIR